MTSVIKNKNDCRWRFIDDSFHHLILTKALRCVLNSRTFFKVFSIRLCGVQIQVVFLSWATVFLVIVVLLIPMPFDVNRAWTNFYVCPVYSFKLCPVVLSQKMIFVAIDKRNLAETRLTPDKQKMPRLLDILNGKQARAVDDRVWEAYHYFPCCVNHICSFLL